MLICKIKANACGQRIQNKGLLALFHGHDPYFDDRDNNKIIRAIHNNSTWDYGLCKEMRY